MQSTWFNKGACKEGKGEVSEIIYAYFFIFSFNRQPKKGVLMLFIAELLWLLEYVCEEILLSRNDSMRRVSDAMYSTPFNSRIWLLKNILRKINAIFVHSIIDFLNWQSAYIYGRCSQLIKSNSLPTEMTFSSSTVNSCNRICNETLLRHFLTTSFRKPILKVKIM